MKIIPYILIKLLLTINFFIISLNVKGQYYDSINSINPFKVKDFDLVYGNSQFDIYDFKVANNYKVLLISKTGEALFILLDKSNLPLDTLSIESAQANIKFWNDNHTFYYSSMFFYKSDLCNLNYKSGVASFTIVDNKLVFQECSILDENYIKDELYQSTNNFKVTLLEKDKKKNEELKKIGFAVNDRLIVKRDPISQISLTTTYFPFCEANGQLFVFDIVKGVLYSFDLDGSYTTANISGYMLLDNSPGVNYSYELLCDKTFNNLYLIASTSFVIKGRGRGKDKIERNQTLYRMENSKWERVIYNIPLYSHKMYIYNKKIYSVFEMNDPETNENRKMLYLSQDFIF